MGKGMGGFGDRGNAPNKSGEKLESGDRNANVNVSGDRPSSIPSSGMMPGNGFDRNSFSKSVDNKQSFDFGNMNNRENQRGMGQMQQGTVNDMTEKIVLTVVSFVILIGGIVFVKKFKI